MEGWMISSVISLIIGLVTYVAIIVTMKNRGESNQKDIEGLKKGEIKLYNRLDKHGDDIVRLNTKSELAMTTKDADATYLRRKEFEQFEKHIDSRFDDIKDGQGTIIGSLNTLLADKVKSS